MFSVDDDEEEEEETVHNFHTSVAGSSKSAIEQISLNWAEHRILSSYGHIRQIQGQFINPD